MTVNSSASDQIIVNHVNNIGNCVKVTLILRYTFVEDIKEDVSDFADPKNAKSKESEKGFKTSAG